LKKDGDGTVYKAFFEIKLFFELYTKEQNILQQKTLQLLDL